MQFIEDKYVSALKSKESSKNDEDHLSDFLFMRECLFPAYATAEISKNSKTESYLHTFALIRGFKDLRDFTEQAGSE